MATGTAAGRPGDLHPGSRHRRRRRRGEGGRGAPRRRQLPGYRPGRGHGRPLHHRRLLGWRRRSAHHRPRDRRLHPARLERPRRARSGAPAATPAEACTSAPTTTSASTLSLEIGVEAYILGISESPYAWGNMGAQAALEAQAVAARSYALHRAIDRGDPASRPWCWCHVYDTTVDQYYAGWGHATQPWLDAVSATAGQVMTHPSETRNGALIPIETFYSSSTFGWTEDSENGFTAYVPYLRAVDDHWSRLASTGNPNARWTRTFTAGDLASRLPGMSTRHRRHGHQVLGHRRRPRDHLHRAGRPAHLHHPRPARPPRPALHAGLQRRRPAARHPALLRPGHRPHRPGWPGGARRPSPWTTTPLGDSRGDADGVAECGEAVEAFTTLTNQGLALAGVSATLTSADPYVTVLWNTASRLPRPGRRRHRRQLRRLGPGPGGRHPDRPHRPPRPARHRRQRRALGPPGGAAHQLAPRPWKACSPPPATWTATASARPPWPTPGTGRPRCSTSTRAPPGEVLATATLAPAGYTPIDAVAVPQPRRLARRTRWPCCSPPPTARPGSWWSTPATGAASTSFGLSRTLTYLQIEACARSRRRLAHPGHPGPGPRRGRPGAQARRRHRRAPGTVSFGARLTPAALVALPGERRRLPPGAGGQRRRRGPRRRGPPGRRRPPRPPA